MDRALAQFIFYFVVLLHTIYSCIPLWKLIKFRVVLISAGTLTWNILQIVDDFYLERFKYQMRKSIMFARARARVRERERGRMCVCSVTWHTIYIYVYFMSNSKLICVQEISDLKEIGHVSYKNTAGETKSRYWNFSLPTFREAWWAGGEGPATTCVAFSRKILANVKKIDGDKRD